MKVGIKLVKVKKFGIGWCIPHRVVDDNAGSHEHYKCSLGGFFIEKCIKTKKESENATSLLNLWQVQSHMLWRIQKKLEKVEMKHTME